MPERGDPIANYDRGVIRGVIHALIAAGMLTPINTSRTDITADAVTYDTFDLYASAVTEPTS